MRKKILPLVLSAVILSSFFALPRVDARQYVSDWYIKNFDSEITLHTDSTMDVVERITADCGNLPDKHGIFRVLPTVARTPDKIYPTPVELVSITDFNGKPYNYSVIDDPFTSTVTWKIGDADVTVQGENNYEIHYRYKNVIRFDDPAFDEFYWNLNGNFWDIETDAFTGRIVIPDSVNKNDVEISYYTGSEGSKSTALATYDWEQPNVVSFVSTGMMKPGDGITASLSFPKSIFTPAELGFFDLYGWILPYLSVFLLPVVTFLVCFVYWFKYGRDTNLKKTAMPEFTVPENLNPMAMMMVKTGGIWKQNFIAAGIVSLATKGLLKINDLKKGIFSSRDYEFVATGTEEQIAALDSVEKKLYNSIFGSAKSIKLSTLAPSFSKSRDAVKKEIVDYLTEKGLFTEQGRKLQGAFVVIGALLLFGLIFFSAFFGQFLGIREDVMVFLVFGSMMSFFILFFFARYMIQRTPKGNEANWHIGNLKMYMETAEKQRAEYYEKENIFEKFLPYAVGFGIVGMWIKKMEQIYGEEYYSTYHPAWYAGSDMDSFSVKSFESALSTMSSSIASSIGTSSGHGGSGGSGGGGGGGGGGGW